jgi:separase
MLWGCSSGALSSNGVHDPTGTCISYLLGGAPFVIGNLWDVTDKDIDKLSVRCMASIFDEQQQEKEGVKESGRVSISRSLSLSRGVCKLKAAVGFAPVMYGLPVGVDNR